MNNSTRIILISIAGISALFGMCGLASLFNRAVGGCLFAIASDNTCNTVVTNTFSSAGSNDVLYLVGIGVLIVGIIWLWPKH